MGQVLKSELPLNQAGRDRVDGWVADPATADVNRLLGFFERVGKGRFAQRLASSATERRCPAYIRAALERIRDAVA